MKLKSIMRRKGLPRGLETAIQFALFGILLWATAWLCILLGSNRATAAMMLLLEVLAIATVGNWVLAFLSSTLASFAFSFFFVDGAGSFRVTTTQGAVSFAAMVLTAFTGSRLAIRAQHRAEEANRRREEMERLNRLGRALLSTSHLAETADQAVRKVVELFALQGAVLRVTDVPQAFEHGQTREGRVSIIPLRGERSDDVLELYGDQPSEEVRNALAGMIGLVLERARGAEERVRMDAIRRGEELRTTVLNAMAHNLKTPLTSIKAAASMLRLSGSISSMAERDLIVVIDEEADRLNRLIRESLEMAKLEARRQNPMTEQCRIPQIVERVVARVSRDLGPREFIVDIPEDLPPVTGDSFLFELMLVQVVDNAWKYSQPCAPIRISGMISGDWIILTVWNQGGEIPVDERDRIFDRFYRGSKDRSRVEGTGLGLAIAKTIAEACKGRIWLDVEPLGPAFRFELPLGAAKRTPGRTNDRKQHHLAH